MVAVLGLTALPPAQQSRVDLHGDPLPAGAVVRLGSTHERRTAYPRTAAWSRDGKLIATGAEDCGVGDADVAGCASDALSTRYATSPATSAAGSATAAASRAAPRVAGSATYSRTTEQVRVRVIPLTS